MQIVDPAEETFPYSGPHRVPRAGRLRRDHRRPRRELARRLHARGSSAHRDEIRAETARLGWSFTIHRTDRPANELLLALHARIGEGNEAAP